MILSIEQVEEKTKSICRDSDNWIIDIYAKEIFESYKELMEEYEELKNKTSL